MRLFRRSKVDHRWKPDFDLLAAYNAEKGRGIQHSPEWDEAMARIQEDYYRTYPEYVPNEPLVEAQRAATDWHKTL